MRRCGRRGTGRLLLGLLALAASGHVAAACLPGAGEGFERAESEDAIVAYRPDEDPVRVGRAFTLHMRVCTPGDEVYPGQLARVDAVMPSHGHGMNYQPEVHAEGEGRYRADGMLLHMPGRWELRFDLDLDGQRQRLTRAYAVR